MAVKKFILNHKNLLISAFAFAAIVLSCSLLSSYSSATSSSAWDGVVARSFAGGTGTNNNPYIISNAAEFAYFKSVLEGEDADAYLDKSYTITGPINYGNYEFNIDNQKPFTGIINGNGNSIYNITIMNSIFNDIKEASLNNINFDKIIYSLTSETGALLAQNIDNSTVNLMLVSGNFSVDSNSSFGGLAFSSRNNTYNNVILNYNVDSSSENITKFANNTSSDELHNVLIKKDNYLNTTSNEPLSFSSFEIFNQNINLIDIENVDDYKNGNYIVEINDGEFSIKYDVPTIIPKQGSLIPKKGPIKAASSITEHASGVDGSTVYINDFTADYNYYKGLNFTEVRSTSIPSGASTGYYDDDYLVKAMIIYDGADVNNSSLVGAMSPLTNENINKYVYYKYFALERNANGTLATNDDGDNYIRIELIDNPFSKRPYVNSTEYGFNGWVCNQESDTTTDLCSASKFSFDNDDYTRYMEIAIDGANEIIVHLNASWYEADVTTSASNISYFNSMSMQSTSYTVTEQETRSASYFWKQNYTQMEYDRTITRNNTLPRYSWYRTSQTSGTYYYISRNNTRCSYTNCYIYTANQTAIPSGSKYEGGSVTFVPNFSRNGNNTETTITTYNTTYMNLLEDPDGEYSLTVNIQKQRSYIPTGAESANGFFYRVNNPTSAMINTGKYYNSSGEVCASANACTTAYKLVQYDDETAKSNGNSISSIESVNDSIVDADRYFYLVTRDMNIFRYTSTAALSFEDLEVNKPFTVTGTSATGNSPTGVLEYPYTTSWWTGEITYSGFTVENDLVIENIKVNGLDSTGSDNLTLGSNSKTSQVIYADSNNLKIGRNVISNNGTGYLIGEAVFGGTNGRSPSGKSRVIIESGLFYAYHSGRMSSSTTNYTFNETTIFGNDYDRVRNNNDKMKLLIGLDGYAGGNNTAGSSSLFASYNIIKSGSFGYNSDGTPNSDNTAGLYIGARSSTYMNSLTGAKIEGGLVNTIVGGYGYNGSATTNSTFIGMSGGSVRSIYGGAGHSTTKGNRIICVTGGTVSYSILGGSDSFESGDTEDGELQGATLVYVGGNVTVGGGTGTLYGVESGSVFGAGGGDTTSTQKGTVYNSHVIINGGTINNSVYGGGNFGSTGTQSTSSATTVIDIYNGTIANVYGGSKSAGFSKSDYSNQSEIDINITGGTITNIYGGSNTMGDIYGTINIDITGGTIGNVYGGGQGYQTTTANDINVAIGDQNSGPSITGNVYGGSAFGSVNSASVGEVNVTVNNGTITGSVFGGGKGGTSEGQNRIPIVNGDVTVTINGGDIGSVFGGNDQAGTITTNDEVHLNGGTIANVYGGGNRSSVPYTNVYLKGASVTNIYGGSNTLGDVTATNVDIISGTVQTVYGGNNEGGTCGTTDVNVTGTATINGSIYGGGNQVNTTTTTVTLNSASGTIPNVYGGGNSASVTTSNVTNNGVTATNIFGGSNSSGTVSTSNIIHNSGTTTNIYGGNNAGGNTISSNINFIGGTATTIYGGGNQANGGSSTVDVSGGNVSTIFGGGNSAGLTGSTINVTAGTIGDIYGGSNTTGDVTTANITITNATSINNIYGGGNRAKVTTPIITVANGTIGNVYGGGNLAEVSGNTTVDINGGTISNVYGGGNFGVVKGNSNVTITDAVITGNAYGGGNGATATLEGNTNITIDGTTTIGTANSTPPNAGCVFGGGNQAYTGIESSNNSTANVNIVGGTIYGNVYGGAKFSVIYGNTDVNIGKSAQTSNTIASPIHITGHVFGGGEANSSGSEIYDWSFISVTQGTNIEIDADTYSNFLIDGSFYGGGNASSASGDSYLLIKNYGIKGTPKQNVSIQRFTYVTIDNSSILLKGAIDRANEYGTELFSLSRIDNLKIKNNTEMYFATGANLLKNFRSVDSNDNIATVTIDKNNNTLSRNVDNRVYMYEGKNLNIAKDQQVTDYGEVSGMTFFGIFNYDNDHNVNTGIYHSRYGAGDTLDWSGTFSRGSYVLGKHLTNHDITVNGFYSNFINEDTTINEVDYIEPTPESARFYMWFIGENVIEYNVNLVASKYSTLGSVEASFLEFSKPNTSFQVLSFDSSEIAQGISLVDKNDIPRIASTTAIANSNFGLSMESSNNGWLTNGKTSFYTREPSISGTTYYEGENSNVVPTMLFYLYHSKNITEAKSLGTVRISVMAITKLNALSNEIKRLVINVNMSTALFQTNEYEGAMTPGDKYELFASTATNITTKSKLSAYYGLYSAASNIYQTGYHRVLTSTWALPEGTKITMLDYSLGTPKYYYHVISAADYAASLTEFQSENECSYALSMFTPMGSLSSTSNYDDATMNAQYYNGADSSEEFIFIVDFEDTTINNDQLNNTLLLEIRDANDEAIITVLGIQHSQLTYNLYANKDATISPTITPSDNPLYIGHDDIFETVINYQTSSLGGVTIIDTQHFDSKLGVQIYIKNSNNQILSGTDLTGVYFTVDNNRYYPDIQGYTHIKLSDKVGNIQKWIIINTDNSSLTTGSYTFVIESFASADGIYYSDNPVVTNIPMTIISSIYGLKPTINEESVILKADNPVDLDFTIDYTSMLTNPNLRIAMYRRKYDQVYDTNYELVDLQDYASDALGTTTNAKEYILTYNPSATNNFTIHLNDNLLTGTYRLSFRLYDDSTYIGEVIRYIIIR